MIIEERDRYHLSEVPNLPSPVFGFDGLGEAVYYRTYSRLKDPDNPASSESWPETIQRVTEGTLSIRKWWSRVQGLPWSQEEADFLAAALYTAMHQMYFLPGGRGLWMAGTEHVYDIGSMALNNCAGTMIDPGSWIEDLVWSMDAMMLGCGVGYNICSTVHDYAWTKPYSFPEASGETYIVADSREGWCDSVRFLLNRLMEGYVPSFNYSAIRAKETPIKRFGGVSSGAGPLILLHRRLIGYSRLWSRGDFSTLRFIADCINAIGACVVSGNVRRGAQILVGHNTPEFLRLKDYTFHPVPLLGEYARLLSDSMDGGRAEPALDEWKTDRLLISGYSNNSVGLWEKDNFLAIPEVVEHIIHNGEPGLINFRNLRAFGRFGHQGESDEDNAIVVNPCSEFGLDHRELCNTLEFFPTRAGDLLSNLPLFGTFYTQTVSLLPTHVPSTNAVIARNRRFGTSIGGVADWSDELGAVATIRALRDLYKENRKSANHWAEASGVRTPIRTTTIVPSGTKSLLAGVSSGMHFPYARWQIRRMRVGSNTDIGARLKAAGVPWEPAEGNPGTDVFEFPIQATRSRPAKEVTVWEQLSLAAMLQREWADNSVSSTIYFHPWEEKDLAKALGHFAPILKAVSLLPHDAGKVYPQMPLQEITEEEYNRRKVAIKPIDWRRVEALGMAQDEERFCQGGACTI